MLQQPLPYYQRIHLLPTAVPYFGVTGAVLGGTQDDFTAAFGPPDLSTGQPHYQTTLSDGVAIGWCFCQPDTGLDGQDRITALLTGSISSTNWLQSATTETMKLFAPHDAVYQRTIHDPDVGPILVYRSSLLAKTFPASSFTDSVSGAALPPGTFAVACQQPSGPGCSIIVGT